MVDPAVSEERARTSEVGRRRFLTYLVAAPTLTVAARLGFEGETAAAQPLLPKLPQISELADVGDAIVLASAPTTPLMVLEVTEDNTVRFELPRLEVGQGLTTTIGMLIAEELDASPSDIEVELSKSRHELLFNQFTGGSSSVRSLWNPVRSMAAAARARLVTAAAQRWDVSGDDLTTKGTKVFAKDGRSATFGELTKESTKVGLLAVSDNPKDSSEYTLVGTPTGRIDARDIVTGKAKYTMDIRVEGALPTVVLRPPTFNATVASLDDSAARAVPGVKAVTQIASGVAVSAEDFHQAQRAKDKLKVTWNPGPVDELSDVDIEAKLNGMADGFLPLDGLTDTVDESFYFAFVNHAPMEVINAVADVREDSAEIWCPSQSPGATVGEIGKAIGMAPSSITLNVTRAGGSFGRWLFGDAAIEAAEVSKAIGQPVHLMWTRNDDMRHGRMRPASRHRIRASHAAEQVLTFQHRMAGVEVDLRHGLGDILSATAAHLIHVGFSQVYYNLSQSVPYNFNGILQTLTELPLEVPTGSWRSVHSASSRTAEEIVVDELAARMGKDPVEFRLEYLATERAKAVLTKVAESGEWGRKMPAGWAQGVGVHEEFKSAAACMVEIDATDPKQPRVKKAVIAVDVGFPINPRGLQAQMSGGLMDAIATVLQAGVHIDKGAVREGSFGDFLWTKQRHSPPDIEVHVMPATSDDPGGAGELGVPTAAAAVANAYARATGTKPRRFPINF